MYLHLVCISVVNWRSRPAHAINGKISYQSAYLACAFVRAIESGSFDALCWCGHLSAQVVDTTLDVPAAVLGNGEHSGVYIRCERGAAARVAGVA